MKYLVTGCDGFIGSHLMNELSDQETYGWSRKTSSNGRRIFVDISDLSSIKESLHSIKPDIILHCAGSADVHKSVEDPHIDYVGNVGLTHNLLFAIHELNMHSIRIIFLSSAAVYGNPISLPVSEDAVINPLSPYALHKYMAEQICEYFVKNYKMSIKVMRIFSAYGEGLRKQIFWDLYSKYQKYGRIKVIGTGEECRDYIYINDVINAIKILTKCDEKEIYYNIANGNAIKIRDAVYSFVDSLGVSREIVEFDRQVRNEDPLVWQADITRIKELGYRPSIGLSEGLEKYTNWLKIEEKGGLCL